MIGGDFVDVLFGDGPFEYELYDDDEYNFVRDASRTSTSPWDIDVEFVDCDLS